MGDVAPFTQAAQLLSLRARIDAVESRVHELTDAATPEQLLWRPSPKEWSVADCVEHLLQADGLYLSAMKPAVASDPVPSAADAAANRAKHFWHTIPARVGLWVAGPGGPKVPAPTQFIPPPASPDAPHRFFAAQREWRDLIATLDGHDIRKLRVASPLTRWVNLQIGSMLEVMIAHQERHIGQAERVRAKPGFPA